MHGTKRVIPIRGQHSFFRKKFANNRNNFAGVSQIPSHYQHQAKSKQKETHSRNGVLQANHFMINRENIFTPERLVMMLCHLTLLIIEQYILPKIIKDYFFLGGLLRTKSAVASPSALTVTVTVFAGNRSCQASTV